MKNYEEEFTKAGFKILQRCTLEKAPANPRERTELVTKALNVGREQVVKALALQAGAPPTTPLSAPPLPTGSGFFRLKTERWSAKSAAF